MGVQDERDDRGWNLNGNPGKVEGMWSLNYAKEGTSRQEKQEADSKGYLNNKKQPNREKRKGIKPAYNGTGSK